MKSEQTVDGQCFSIIESDLGWLLALAETEKLDVTTRIQSAIVSKLFNDSPWLAARIDLVDWGKRSSNKDRKNSSFTLVPSRGEDVMVSYHQVVTRLAVV